MARALVIILSSQFVRVIGLQFFIVSLSNIYLSTCLTLEFIRIIFSLVDLNNRDSDDILNVDLKNRTKRDSVYILKADFFFDDKTFLAQTFMKNSEKFSAEYC